MIRTKRRLAIIIIGMAGSCALLLMAAHSIVERDFIGPTQPPSPSGASQDSELELLWEATTVDDSGTAGRVVSAGASKSSAPESVPLMNRLARAVMGRNASFVAGSAAEKEAAMEYCFEAMRRALSSRTERRAARFLGFGTWEALQSEAERLKSEDPATYQIFQSFLDDAYAIATAAHLTAEEAFYDPMMMECWHDSQPHDSEAWVAERPRHPLTMINFTHINGVRGWHFKLHYKSHYFPEVEQQARDLQSRFEDFQRGR